MAAPDGSFLQLFWDLASVDLEARVRAADGLLDHLRRDQDAFEADAAPAEVASDAAAADGEGGLGEIDVGSRLQRCCDSLQYAVKRLVRGLCSSRDAARQGFATALTAVLESFHDVPLDAVLGHVRAVMDLAGRTKGQEERDIMFGRIFAALAVQRSGRYALAFGQREIPAAETRAAFVWREFVALLVPLAARKSWAAELVYQTILLMLQEAPPAVQRVHGGPLLAEFISGAPVSDMSPDVLALAVGWRAAAAAAVGEGKPLRKAGYPEAVARALDAALQEPKQLQQPLRAAAGAYPRVHTAWLRILDVVLPPPAGTRHAAAGQLVVGTRGARAALEDAAKREQRAQEGRRSKPAKAGKARAASTEAEEEEQGSAASPLAECRLDTLAALWRDVVESSLFGGRTNERMAVGFAVAEVVFARVPADGVAHLLTPRFLRVLASRCADKSKKLHAPAMAALRALRIAGSRSSSARAAVATALLSRGSAHFDRRTGTKTVAELLHGLDASDAESFLGFLEQSFLHPLRRGAGEEQAVWAPADEDEDEDEEEEESGKQKEKEEDNEDNEEDEDEDEDEEVQWEQSRARRAWAVDGMLGLMRATQGPGGARVLRRVLTFLLAHAFAEVTPEAAQAASQRAAEAKAALEAAKKAVEAAGRRSGRKGKKAGASSPTDAQAAQREAERAETRASAVHCALHVPSPALTPSDRELCESRLFALQADLASVAPGTRKAAAALARHAQHCAGSVPEGAARLPKGGSALSRKVAAAVDEAGNAWGPVALEMWGQLQASGAKGVEGHPSATEAATEAWTTGWDVLQELAKERRRVEQEVVARGDARAAKAAAANEEEEEEAEEKGGKAAGRRRSTRLGGSAQGKGDDDDDDEEEEEENEDVRMPISRAQELRAMEQLLSHLVLRALSDGEDSAGVLPDLILSYRDLRAGVVLGAGMGQEQASSEGDAEGDVADPAGVMVDVLLNVLLHSGSRMRDVVRRVMRALATRMTPLAVSQMVNVVAPHASGMNELLSISGGEDEGHGEDNDDDDDDEDEDEDEDDEDEDEDEENGDGANDKGASASAGMEEEEEEDEDEAEDEDEDEAEDEDEDEDEDEKADASMFSKEAMERQDQLLAMIVRQHQRKSHRQRHLRTQTLHFRARALDLVEAMVGRAPTSPLLLYLAVPMLRSVHGCMAHIKRAEDRRAGKAGNPLTNTQASHVRETRAYMERLRGVIARLCRNKAMPTGEGAADMVGEAHKALVQIVFLARRSPVSEFQNVASSLVVYILRVLRHTSLAGLESEGKKETADAARQQHQGIDVEAIVRDILEEKRPEEDDEDKDEEEDENEDEDAEDEDEDEDAEDEEDEEDDEDEDEEKEEPSPAVRQKRKGRKRGPRPKQLASALTAPVEDEIQRLRRYAESSLGLVGHSPVRVLFSRVYRELMQRRTAKLTPRFFRDLIARQPMVAWTFADEVARMALPGGARTVCGRADSFSLLHTLLQRRQVWAGDGAGPYGVAKFRVVAPIVHEATVAALEEAGARLSGEGGGKGGDSFSKAKRLREVLRAVQSLAAAEAVMRKETKGWASQRAATVDAIERIAPRTTGNVRGMCVTCLKAMDAARGEALQKKLAEAKQAAKDKRQAKKRQRAGTAASDAGAGAPAKGKGKGEGGGGGGDAAAAANGDAEAPPKKRKARKSKKSTGAKAQ